MKVTKKCDDCIGCGWIPNPDTTKIITIRVPFILCKTCDGLGRVAVEQKSEDHKDHSDSSSDC